MMTSSLDPSPSPLKSSHTSLRIIFAGTPDFAASALSALIEAGHHICAVYTQPDRPAGRGRKLKPGPVKQVALEHNIPVCQPLNFKAEEDITALNDWQADLMIVAAYGLLLPKAVLDAPRLGCINIHASLLPRWRGAAPIQRAIVAGDNETGITIMQMDVGLDTGDMLLKLTCPILENETGGSLHDRLAKLGAEAIIQALKNLDEYTANAEKQDNTQANYAHKLDKKEALIDWNLPAVEIERKIRAFNPWPVSYTLLEKDKPLRIWQASTLEADGNQGQPGCVIASAKAGIDVACGKGSLRLEKIQPPGGKALDVAAFLNGHPDVLVSGRQLVTQPDTV